MSGAAPITRNTSLKPRAAASLFSIMTLTVGWTSISPTERASIPTGPPAKPPLLICTKIIVMEPSQTSPKNPASPAPAGRPVSASAITTTTARTISSAASGDTNVLFHNNGDGTFTDVSAKSGILKPGPRYSITAVSYDFDNDGWPDIYVAVDSEPSILFHNNHDGTFTDVAVIAGCAYSENGHEQAGMGVAVADYDCDGWLDIFKTNFADDTCNLYHNNGDGTFSDVTFSSGIGINNHYVAWGCG